MIGAPATGAPGSPLRTPLPTANAADCARPESRHTVTDSRSPQGRNEARGRNGRNRRSATTLAQVVVLGLVLALLSGCWGGQREATSAAPTATTALAPSPMTVEVTRIVVTERIVTATPEPPLPCALPTLADAAEVVVAAILPLSQVNSLPGTLAVQVALNLAAAEINANGGIAGKPVRIWFGDAGGSPERTAEATRRAISEQCAVAILATQTAETVQTIAAVAQGTGTPVLILEASDDALTANAAPHLFRLAPANAMLASMYGDWLAAVGDYNGDGQRQVLLVIEANDAARSYADMIAGALTSREIAADSLEVDLPRTDFSSLIARIVVRETAPDAILIRFGGDSAATFQRQLVENGIGPTRQTLLVAIRQALQHETFWPMVGAAGAYTVVGRAGPWASTVNARGAAFAESFAGWLARWPESSAFFAYDALYLLADAVARAASLNPGDLNAALETTNMVGAAGRYSFPVNSRTAPAGATAAGQPAWAWHQWMEPPLLFLQYTVVGQPSSEMAVIWPPLLAGDDGPVVRPPAP